VRLFFAFDIPQRENERVQAALSSLAQVLEGARVIPFEDRHVTLRFLGEVDDETVPAVVAAARSAAAGAERGYVSLEGLGAFPHQARARVLWAGITDPSSAAARLAGALGAMLVPLGFEPEERAYVPHLTLARFRTPVALPPGFETHLSEGPRFPLASFNLVQSHVTSAGARYEVMESFALG
jgi:2'-5' RNA ligase